MNLTLTVLAHRRPHYFNQTLKAIQELKDSDKWEFVLVLDNPDEETLELSKQSGLSYIHSVLPAREGIDEYDTSYRQISLMTYLALNTSFNRGADFVAHLEEDIVPHPNFLSYMGWAATNYKDKLNILTVNAWRGPKYGGDYSRIYIEPWFTPWGWGTWKNRWNKIASLWSFNRWDQQLNEVIREDRLGIFPHTSLTRNIGAVGTQPINEYFEREQLK